MTADARVVGFAFEENKRRRARRLFLQVRQCR
jgi:hypothetical protein